MPVSGSVSNALSSGDVTSLSFSHTCNGQPLYVPLSWYVGSGLLELGTVTAVQFDGHALTKLHEGTVLGNTHNLWRLQSPPSVTGNVVITLSSARRVSAAAMQLTGWPDSAATIHFAYTGGLISGGQTVSLAVPSSNDTEILVWTGYNWPAQVVTPGDTLNTGSPGELWDQQGTGGGVGADGDQMTTGWLVAGVTPQVTASITYDDPEYIEISAAWFVAAIDGPVAYEDPCAITEPRIFATITYNDPSTSPPTSEVLKFGVHPLRDPAELGGFAEPRLLECSPVSRVASDPSTGAWSAQTATIRIADTDRVYRAMSDSRTSFRNCNAELYLTSNANRLLLGPPRVLFSGTIFSDTAEENLVHRDEINDLIGSNYTLFAEEKQIPQRTIDVQFFPNCPEDNIGLGEPIIGGRVGPLTSLWGASSQNRQGVVDGLHVGRVKLNGSLGTPGAGDLTAVVAALQAAYDDGPGQLRKQFGSRIGYADADELEEYADTHSGTIPSSQSTLEGIIGVSDLADLLKENKRTGGTYVAVLVAGHAIKQVLDGANGDPSVWIDDEQLDPAELGTSWWCPNIPGDTTWASEFGSNKYTDITSTGGGTRRYTLILFDPGSDYADAVETGGRVHLDLVGLEGIGDGTGTALTDYFDLYKHVLINFILQDYQSGTWLSSPQFLFSDGSTLIDRVNEASFDAASAFVTLNAPASLAHPGGYVGGFKIGDRTSVRDVIAHFNLSGGCLLAQDDYGRLFVKVLDTRRTTFLTNASGDVHRTLRDKRDFLPGFTIERRPDWQANWMQYQYARHYYLGDFERGDGGGGSASKVEDTAAQDRDGLIKKTIQLEYIRDDRTALAVAEYYLSIFKDEPRVARYTRRGLCGLEDDVLDGVPITHFNGFGANGWQDHAVWILSKTFNPKTLTCEFTALDVEHLLED